MGDTEDDIHVHCPNCQNKRLFDTTQGAEGIVKIKCPKCKMVAVICLQNVNERRRMKRMKAYAKVMNEQQVS